MKRNILLIFVLALVSCGLHLYLSKRMQSITIGKVGHSNICYISDQFSCDSTLASSYSQFAGLHVSDWGFATNFMILLFSLSLMWGLAEAYKAWLALFFFSSLSVLASIVMLAISFFVINLFCPVCIALYGLSFLVFGILLLDRENILFSQWKSLFPKFLLSVFGAWILVGFLNHLIFVSTKNQGSVKKIVSSNMQDWLSAPRKNIEGEPLLVKTPSSSASMTVTEFADFLCPHCRDTYYLLKMFKNSHPDIKIMYFSFPLDHCSSEGSVSCFLTKLTYCAEKQNQGWLMHDLIYENQNFFIKRPDTKKIVQRLKENGKNLSMDWKEWNACLDTSSANEISKKQVKAGEKVGIQGTPTLFVNEKKIETQYLIHTLKALKTHLSKEASK